eukprot:8882553-Prorocentrum_lima.AAC.1
MTSSLVGSEMCIRDSVTTLDKITGNGKTIMGSSCLSRWEELTSKYVQAVSYTHLTLPTICSV